MSDKAHLDPSRRLPPPLKWLRSGIRAIRYRRLQLLTRGRLQVGDNVSFGPACTLHLPNSMRVGNNVSIGGRFFCQTDVEMGDDCLLSTGVSFVGNDHDILGSPSAFFSGREPPSRVVLEGNNFIGYGATLCGNVTLGKGSVVGARALVLESVPPYAVVGGVPAKILKYRDRPHDAV